MAIAAQQAHEGYTWDEWVQFGVPKAGHTRCGEHCRCKLTPYLYVNVSTELQHMSIMVEGDLPERTQRIISMLRQWGRLTGTWQRFVLSHAEGLIGLAEMWGQECGYHGVGQ